MSKLVQHIEDMGALLTQTTKHEQSLVKALADALGKVDQQLVHDIRKVGIEHQARRAEIFLELQALAGTIGMFPIAHEVAIEPPANDGHDHFPAMGDWRQAAQNVSYQDELDYHLRTKGPAQH